MGNTKQFGQERETIAHPHLKQATIPADHAYYFKRKRRKIQEAPDVFNPGVEHAILESVVSNVVAVKVEFNFALLPGQKQVDAIGISDSEQPIDAEINVGAQFKKYIGRKFPILDSFQVLSLVVAPGGEKMLFTQQSEGKGIGLFLSEGIRCVMVNSQIRTRTERKWY